MNTIETRYNQEIEAESKIKTFLNEGKIASLKNACDILWYKYEIFSIYHLISNDINNFKLSCYINGRLDEYRIRHFNDRVLDYGINHISYVLLSDAGNLISDYSLLRYYRGENAEMSMDEMVEMGKPAIWVNTIQAFMANNTERIERNLDIIENKVLKKLQKKEEGLKDDYEFYKALHNNEKEKMEEVLEKLTSPTIHKKRNDNPLLNQYISIPAIGYAKLAWLKGILVKTNSPLIPEIALPIKPLAHYQVPYSFLSNI